MAAFLGAVESASGLPRTILYSLNPADDQAIDTLCGCFQSSEAVSKMQHGSAWWFNDHFTGMTNQLTSLANLGYLAGFVGMLTDSRSFLSYPRHEYFRRICAVCWANGWRMAASRRTMTSSAKSSAASPAPTRASISRSPRSKGSNVISA